MPDLTKDDAEFMVRMLAVTEEVFMRPREYRTVIEWGDLAEVFARYLELLQGATETQRLIFCAVIATAIGDLASAVGAKRKGCNHWDQIERWDGLLVCSICGAEIDGD